MGTLFLCQYLRYVRNSAEHLLCIIEALSNAVKSLFTFSTEILSANNVRLCFDTLILDHQIIRPSGHQAIRSPDCQPDCQPLPPADRFLTKSTCTYLAVIVQVCGNTVILMTQPSISPLYLPQSGTLQDDLVASLNVCALPWGILM